MCLGFLFFLYFLMNWYKFIIEAPVVCEKEVTQMQFSINQIYRNSLPLHNEHFCLDTYCSSLVGYHVVSNFKTIFCFVFKRQNRDGNNCICISSVHSFGLNITHFIHETNCVHPGEEKTHFSLFWDLKRLSFCQRIPFMQQCQ